jgi:hypothetical protein
MSEHAVAAACLPCRSLATRAIDSSPVINQRGEQSELLTHIATTARRLRIQLSGRTVWIDQTFLQKG